MRAQQSEQDKDKRITEAMITKFYLSEPCQEAQKLLETKPNLLSVKEQ